MSAARSSEPPPETLLLRRVDVAALLSLPDCVEAVEAALVRHAAGETLGPAVLGLRLPGGALHVKAAGLAGEAAYVAAKLNANLPDNPRHGRPAIQGLIALFDGARGVPLAVMDAIEITVLRTAAMSAVAARRLARPDARTLALCGCGTQGRAHLDALLAVRPFRSVRLYDVDAARAEALARRASERGLEATVAATPVEAVRGADVVATCSPSRAAYLRAGDLAPGAFLAAVGADAPDKQELEPALLAASKVVVDSREQCLHMGELHHAVASGAMCAEDVYAEIAEVVSGRREPPPPGATVVFDSTGTAVQDVAAAALVYERARASGRGLSLALLA
jgi:ornithine cyclodeaminase/alanine dehydrogenase-like protein (mu-crystallin family)